MLIRYFLLIISVLFFSSCAHFHKEILSEYQDWESNHPDSTLKKVHTVFLIGDTGYSHDEKSPPAVAAMARRMKTAGKDATVVFLGDNLYPTGLAPRSYGSFRDFQEKRLVAQLKAINDFEGNIYFIAGNHDWWSVGVPGIRRQKKFIESYLGREDVFLPEPGCGGPEEIELTENLTLLLIDSQWWLADWQGETLVNAACDIVKSRKSFAIQFEDLIKGNRNKNILIALHHPIITNGPHGGHYTWRQHIFPIADIDKSLMVPLPVIGSMVAFLRATIGTSQDITHPNYQALIKALLASTQKNGSFVFASGHEHNLQYAERNDQHFIVSGAGSKKSPSRAGGDVQFSYPDYGYAQMDYYEDGSSWVSYRDTSNKLLFKKKVSGPLTMLEAEPTYDFSLYKSGKKSVTVPVSKVDYKRGLLGRWWWGDHYRDVYNMEIKVPVLDLKKYKNGVVPVKEGGGYQTNSLKLENDAKKEFKMRAIQKDPTRIVPYPFNETFVVDVFRDNFSAAHPEAAFPVSALSRAAGIFHTNPELYFVPKQPLLGKYNEKYGDELYLVEEHPKDNREEIEGFGYSKKIISTYDVIDKVVGKHDHFIAQDAVLRARLFDLIIGDWDRHDDQWRWASFKKDGKTIYKPIPRDRDQAFSKYDGAVMALVRQTIPFMKQLRVFDEKYDNIKWMTYNGRHFDRTFLTEMEWKDFEREVQHLQHTLSDSIIYTSLKQNFSPEIFEATGEEIFQKLKARRDKLPGIAHKFYTFISKEVDVVGTDKRDLFLVERLDGGETSVRVYDTNKEGQQEALLYERLFKNDITKEIRLYGLDDQDIFKIGGNVRSGLVLRLIGGLGNDIYEDSSNVKLAGRKTKIYEFSGEENVFLTGREAKIKITKDITYNIWDRRSFDYEYNFHNFLPGIGFNPDDGILAGLRWTYTTYGFKKSPYAQKHTAMAQASFETGGLEIDYYGEFTDAIGNWELGLGANWKNDLYTINYYGLGNETSSLFDDREAEEHFYRVRQNSAQIKPGIIYSLREDTRFSFGLRAVFSEVESTENRFITTPQAAVREQVFTDQFFGAAWMQFEFASVNDKVYPSRGLRFHISGDWTKNLKEPERTFPAYKTAVSIYQYLGPPGYVTLATRLGYWRLFGDDYEFFQAATLGGTGSNPNFRGFVRNRFTGQRAFYHNSDLRVRFGSVHLLGLATSIGVFGGFDYGRVWLPDDESEKWHHSYGGGLFLQPLDFISINFSYFLGDGENSYFNLKSGFFF